MLKVLLVVALLPLSGLMPAFAQAQGTIWRCGNEYTNNPGDAAARGCKPMEGGNLTVIEAARPSTTAPAATPSATPAPNAAPRNGTPRVGSADQRARDSDAQAVLQAELRRAETRLREAQTAYNNGEPERLGSEANYQRYLDRVEKLKADVERAQADVDGLRRELARTGGGSGGGTSNTSTGGPAR